MMEIGGGAIDQPIGDNAGKIRGACFFVAAYKVVFYSDKILCFGKIYHRDRMDHDPDQV